MSQKKTISLVLGGGGARGLAHLGVIRSLNEQDYRIESISGSSIGALVGGIYATGKLDLFEHWVVSLEKLDILRLLDFSLNFSRGGVLRGDKIVEALKQLVGDHLIEELPIEFTAVACDLNRQREVWLKYGSLFDAIRASIAIPTLFTPVHSKGRLLVDGGLVNPVPVTPTLRDQTKMVIAVNVNAPTEPGIKAVRYKKRKPDTWYRGQIKQFIDNIGPFKNHEAGGKDSLKVMIASYETIVSMVTRFQMALNPPDVIINIPINISTFYEFHHAFKLIEFGYKRANEILAKDQSELYADQSELNV